MSLPGRHARIGLIDDLAAVKNQRPVDIGIALNIVVQRTPTLTVRPTHRLRGHSRSITSGNGRAGPVRAIVAISR